MYVGTIYACICQLINSSPLLAVLASVFLSTTSSGFFPAPLGAGTRPAGCIQEAASRDANITFAGESWTPLLPCGWRRLSERRPQNQLAPQPRRRRPARWLAPKDGCGLRRPPTAASARATATTTTATTIAATPTAIVFCETGVRGTARARRRGGRLCPGTGLSRRRPPRRSKRAGSCGDKRLGCSGRELGREDGGNRRSLATSSEDRRRADGATGGNDVRDWHGRGKGRNPGGRAARGGGGRGRGCRVVPPCG